MDINAKIKLIAETMSGYTILVDSSNGANVELSKITMPCILVFIQETGEFASNNSHYRDSVNIRVAFLNKMPKGFKESDVEAMRYALKQDMVILYHKLKFDFQFKINNETVRYEIVYDEFDDNLIGVVFNDNIKERVGLNLACDVPDSHGELPSSPSFCQKVSECSSIVSINELIEGLQEQIDNLPTTTGVQSVTGPNVDNTDPLNPIVNPLVTTSNGYYNVKDYGAVGDGTTDDAAAILLAITASYTATGNVNLYFPNAIYKVNSQIEIDHPTANVNIVGNGSILKSGLTVVSVILKVSSCNFLDIDNLKFDFNSNPVAQYGIVTGSYANSKYVKVARISRCDFYNFGVENQRGILIENTPATSGLASRNTVPSITINRCNFYNQQTFEFLSINYNTATLYGIGIELGEFSDNTIVSECNFIFIRIAIWSAAGANLTIANNNFIACFPKFLGSYSYGVIYVPNTGGNNGKINIIGNKINHNYGPCIYNKYATSERPMTISDNQFIANCTAPIQITNTSAINSYHQIKNNYFERASQAFTQSLTNQPFGALLQPYIVLNNQRHCKIKGNQFLNDATYGVLSINNSNFNSVKNNDWYNITGISSLVGANNIVSDNDNL